MQSAVAHLPDLMTTPSSTERWPDDMSTARTMTGSEQRLVLKLYVCGAGPRAESAMANLRHVCEHDLGGDCSLEVIDVLEHPDRAEEAKVLATPTLIKLLPAPLRRIIGDLSDKDKLLVGLDVARVAKRESPSNSEIDAP